MARVKQESPLFIPKKSELSKFSILISNELQELIRKYKEFLKEIHEKDYSIDEITSRILETIKKDTLFKKWLEKTNLESKNNEACDR